MTLNTIDFSFIPFAFCFAAGCVLITISSEFGSRRNQVTVIGTGLVIGTVILQQLFSSYFSFAEVFLAFITMVLPAISASQLYKCYIHSTGGIFFKSD